MKRFLVFVSLLCVLAGPSSAAVSVSWEGNKLAANFMVTPLPSLNGMARVRVDWVATARVGVTWWGDQARYGISSLPDVGSVDQNFYQPNNSHDEWRAGWFIAQAAPGTIVTFNESAMIYQQGAGWFGGITTQQTATRTIQFPPLDGGADKGDFGAPRFLEDFVNFVADPVNPVSGEFFAHAVDLEIAGPFPIRLSRTYSSRNVASNELGYGWLPGHVSYLIPAADLSTLQLATPGGSVLNYRRQGTSDLWQLDPLDNPEMHHVQTGENYLGSTIERTGAAGATRYTLRRRGGHASVYLVRSFPTATLQRERPYLEKETDPHGNEHRYTYGSVATAEDYGKIASITGSNGRSLTLRYNAAGLLREAEASDGRLVTYGYTNGDLTSVTLPDDAQFAYRYTLPTTDTFGHLLDRETRPEGRVLENDYDAMRRVKEQRATVDPTRPGTLVRNATFDYSIANQTIVTDAYGRATTYEHANGLVTAIREPHNRTTTQEWHAATDAATGAFARALKKTTDPRGLVTEFKYDVRGNVRETKYSGDLDGDGVAGETEAHTISANYDSVDLPQWVSDDVAGLKTEFFYEDTDYPRLPTRVVKRLVSPDTVLRTDKFDYTERSETVGDVTTFARGLLEKSTIAAGAGDEAVTEFDYNATGFRTKVTRRTGTTDPDVVQVFAPTARGEIESITDAASRATSFTYDGRSRPLTTTVKDAAGAIVAASTSAYTGNGEIRRIDGPRPGEEDLVEHSFDQAGRPAQTTLNLVQAKADGSGIETPPVGAAQAVAKARHDLFGNLVLSNDPRGHVATRQYDGLGRLTHVRRFAATHAAALLTQYEADQLAPRSYDGSLPTGVTALATELFTYHPGGEVHVHTSVLGGTTTTLYNARGQPRHRTHADGSVEQWRYRADGRLVKEILRNGTSWETAYDEPARSITRALKKADGTALAAETRVFNRRGNLTSFTDAEGHAFATTYDDLDRVKTETGPPASAASAQRVATWTYDAADIVRTVTNALGERTVETRDALGRVTRVEIRDAGDAIVRETSLSYAADHRSVTRTEGAGGDAVAITEYPDTRGQIVLTRYSDGTFSRQSYDLGGLPDTFHDALARPTATTFDALGHLATRTLPDAHLTTFVHNAAGQLRERRMSSPQGELVAQTVFDPAGRPTSSSLKLGAQETRATSHTYFPSNHATWAGLPATTTDPRSVVRTFAYDDFLRVATVTTDGPAAETDSTTTYGYDKRGWLTSVAQSSPNGAAGPATSVARTLDAYGEITQETVTVGGVVQAAFTQRWDAAGHRWQLAPGALAPLADPGAFRFDYRADGAMRGAALAGAAATFSFNTAGQLAARTNLWRTQTVTQRDLLGRPTQIATVLPAPGHTLQTENQLWRADGTRDSYGVVRSGLGAWNESRAYGYNSRAQLESEGFSPAPGQTAALAFVFDHGASGLGVRTEAKVGTGASAAWQSRVPGTGGLDAFGRAQRDDTNAAGRAVPAAGAALGADFVELWVNGSSRGRAVHPGWADATGAWSGTLALDAGAQTLEARAAHPSGSYTATATASFTVNAPLAAVESAFDAEGHVTSRSFADGRSQTLGWDAASRLIKVTERNASGDGYDWSAVYDGLGRRLRTTHQPVSGGAASGTATLASSLYDPEAEFLEVAAIVNGAVAWKLHGPDLDGRYGGWNGTGGLEAVLTPKDGSFAVKAAVADAFGNLVAIVTGLGPLQKAEWVPTRVGSYGPLPNHRAEILLSPARVAEASAWRTRRIDPTGFYWLGARYYEPHSGRFLSPDPLGHASDLTLYGFADGDPVNRFDPDGRFGKALGGEALGLGDRLGTGLANAYGFGQDAFAAALLAGLYRESLNDFRFNSDAFNNPNRPTVYGGYVDAGALIGTFETGASVGSFGLYNVAQGGYGIATGDYRGAQDHLTVGFLGLLALRAAVGTQASPEPTVRGEPSGTVPRLTQSVGDLRAAGLKDAHHVIQDAAVRNLPGYNTRAAPGVQLPGPSTAQGTPHYIATQIQRGAGGGSYAAERAIAYKALRRAGHTEAQARQIIAETDAYFQGIGVTSSTPTRIPGNRN